MKVLHVVENLHRGSVERWALRACALFYRIPRVILAPNEDLRAILVEHTGRPTVLMSRGVDTNMFTPGKRTRTDEDINIGYVGRLSPEKGVRILADIHDALKGRGTRSVRFTIVGDGSEREWLRAHPTITVATYAGGWPPFERYENATLSGLGPAYLDDVARQRADLL